MARLGQFRRDTDTNWLKENPILADGEFILVATDSANPRNYNKWKCGNGTSTFSQLPYQQDLEVIGFTGEISNDETSSLYPDNLFISGLYIKKAKSNEDQTYILWVRNFPTMIYQMRIYVQDNSFKNIIANRSYDKENEVWSDWNSQEIATFDKIFGFAGSQPNSIVDTIITPGTYIQMADAKTPTAQAYILTVREINGKIHQSRERYNDGGRFISEYRVKTGENWEPWIQNEFAWKKEIYTLPVFEGYIEVEDISADNYIDKVTTTGIYKRNKNGYPIIYFVKNINGITYQTQFYYNDGLELVFRIRKLENGTWSDWSTQNFAFDIRTFKFDDIDNIKSYGTYISSTTYDNGILYVMKANPNLKGFDTTQILYINDVNSGILKKGIRHYETSVGWTGWGWEGVENTFLQSQISKNGVNFDLNSYSQYHGYISQRDLSIVENENYRTISILLTDIPEGQKFLTVPCQGGAILLVGYWKGDYNDSSNYLGRDSITAFSNAGNQMYTNVPLSNLIPEGTIYMTLCWSAAIGSPKLTIFNPDLNKNSTNGNVSGTILPSTYLGQREVIYGGMTNAYLYKRGALLNIAGQNSDLIIIAGQSNADGKAVKEEAPQWLIDMNYKIDHYLMWNPIAKQFQPWELGVNTGSENNTKNEFGFDIYFAKKYFDANPTKILYAIKQTVGGTPISPLRAEGETRAYCWTPFPELIKDGGISMCNQLIEKIKDAYQYAANNNIILTPQVLLWHQGEADMTDTRAPYFEDNLKGLFSWMRGIWAAPALPIINGQISSYYDTEWQPTYSANKAFTALNEIDSYFKTVNMEGQPMLPDNVHFKAAGYEHMGYEMWNYYLEFNPIF